jgi:group I intron endonuclease
MGCVYSVRNKINDMLYVGKTERTLAERRSDHEYNAAHGAQSYFYNALRKYGFDTFEWMVLEEDDDSEWLIWSERRYIAKLKSKAPNGYNMTDGGDGLTNPTEETRRRIGDASRGRECSEETRMKLSIASKNPENIEKVTAGKRTPEAREKFRRSSTGRVHTEESKHKQSASLIGHPVTEETRRKIGKAKKGQTHTEESRLKMSLSQRGKKRTEAFKRRVSEVHTGKVNSPETKQKMSESQKKRWADPTPEMVECAKANGRKTAGRKQSEEERKKRSAALIGHKTSDETKAKLSASLAGNPKLKEASIKNRVKRQESLRRWNKWRDWESCAA